MLLFTLKCWWLWTLPVLNSERRISPVVETFLSFYIRPIYLSMAVFLSILRPWSDKNIQTHRRPYAKLKQWKKQSPCPGTFCTKYLLFWISVMTREGHKDSDATDCSLENAIVSKFWQINTYFKQNSVTNWHKSAPKNGRYMQFMLQCKWLHGDSHYFLLWNCFLYLFLAPDNVQRVSVTMDDRREKLCKWDANEMFVNKLVFRVSKTMSLKPKTNHRTVQRREAFSLASWNHLTQSEALRLFARILSFVKIRKFFCWSIHRFLYLAYALPFDDTVVAALRAATGVAIILTNVGLSQYKIFCTKVGIFW